MNTERAESIGLEKAKAAAYISMRDDILSEMYKVFGTKDIDSANADYASYSMKLVKPEIFINSATDDNDIAFPTVEALKAHAQEKITAIEQYAVYRDTRKKEYREEIKQLQGGM